MSSLVKKLSNSCMTGSALVEVLDESQNVTRRRAAASEAVLEGEFGFCLKFNSLSLLASLASLQTSFSCSSTLQMVEMVAVVTFLFDQRMHP